MQLITGIIIGVLFCATCVLAYLRRKDYRLISRTRQALEGHYAATANRLRDAETRLTALEHAPPSEEAKEAAKKQQEAAQAMIDLLEYTPGVAYGRK